MKVIPIKKQYRKINFNGTVTPNDMLNGPGISFDNKVLAKIQGIEDSEVTQVNIFQRGASDRCVEIILDDDTYISTDGRTLRVFNGNPDAIPKNKPKVLSRKLNSWVFGEKDLRLYMGDVDDAFARAIARIRRFSLNVIR